jgi:putative transposase
VALETLNVSGMMKNHKLAKSIGDASWSEFVSMLIYKAEWSGKNILRIGRFEPSSKLCSCGKINSSLALSDRTWTCGACGTTHDRDILAANNIKRMALHPQSLIHQVDFNTVGHTEF